MNTTQHNTKHTLHSSLYIHLTLHELFSQAHHNIGKSQPIALAKTKFLAKPSTIEPKQVPKPLAMSLEANEINSAPITPRPAVSCPPSQYHSPSLSRSPLLNGEGAEKSGERGTTKAPKTPIRTPKLSLTPRFITPLGSPVRKALRMTKLDPQDAWLPITESRNGNKYYAAFHTLCSGIGIQALVLPVAFTILGWSWGIICLSLAFIWQLYTLWILVQLHESVETGVRYNRYLQLFSLTFGDRLTNLVAVFPVLYLSGGTCVALIIIGGSTGKLFFQTVCGAECARELTNVEWYLAFTCVAVVLSQLPNMNSIAGVSLVGAITAVGYCTLIWGISVAEGRLPGVSYDPVRRGSQMEQVFSVLNALGIIAFAFRGHNLILEIQATMPSSEKHPSHVPMWKGVKASYSLIAACLFPLAIGGYWAYGHLIPPNGGMLTALFQFHSRDVSKFALGLTSFFVIINAVSSFQIYGMPMFDDIESKYTIRMKKPLPWWLRAISRALFGFGCFFVAVAMPFLGSFAGLIGGIALPVTLAYPCFMWLKIKKPKKYSPIWWLNWFLGVLGMSLSGILVAAGVYVVIDTGIQVSFFKPHLFFPEPSFFQSRFNLRLFTMTKYGEAYQTSSSSTSEITSTENPSPSLSVNDYVSNIITNHKLNGQNFLQWSQSVFMFICGRGKDGHLTGEISTPNSTNPTYRTWKTNDHLVMSWLINSMTADVGLNFLKQGEMLVTQYFNLLTRCWLQLDLYETHSWKCNEDAVLYKQIVEQKRTMRFLLGLNKELDEVRGRIMGIKPFPNLKEAFAEVQREESRKKLMMSEIKPSIDSSALLSHNPQSQGQGKGRPCCEHCKKPRHWKATCWKIHGKPND